MQRAVARKKIYLRKREDLNPRVEARSPKTSRELTVCTRGSFEARPGGPDIGRGDRRRRETEPRWRQKNENEFVRGARIENRNAVKRSRPPDFRADTGTNAEQSGETATKR